MLKKYRERQCKRSFVVCGLNSALSNFPPCHQGGASCSVNMATEDEELDFRSGSFNASKAISSSDIRIPVPEAEEYDNLDELRRKVHSQKYNTVRELPGVSYA